MLKREQRLLVRFRHLLIILSFRTELFEQKKQLTIFSIYKLLHKIYKKIPTH